MGSLNFHREEIETRALPTKPENDQQNCSIHSKHCKCSVFQDQHFSIQKPGPVQHIQGCSDGRPVRQTHFTLQEEIQTKLQEVLWDELLLQHSAGPAEEVRHQGEVQPEQGRPGDWRLYTVFDHCYSVHVHDCCQLF